jgi:cytochrome oxidase Cu insertion factor (SCO1/SenC/PrrC family)
MKRRYVVIGVVAALAALAGGTLAIAHTFASSTASPQYRGSTPPPGIQLPSFTLRDQRGGVVTSNALRGRIVVMTFLETKCKSSCPFIAGRIGMAFRRMSPEQRRGVTTLALSMNPKDDGPASARAFLSREHVASFVQYLLGSERQLRPVWNAFHVLAALDTGDADTHSASIRIYNRDGEWVSNLHVGVDLTPESLIHDIAAAKGA